VAVCGPEYLVQEMYGVNVIWEQTALPQGSIMGRDLQGPQDQLQAEERVRLIPLCFSSFCTTIPERNSHAL